MNEATQNANAQDGPRVSELTPGQVFTGRYACARKDRMTSKNGSAYLNLELRDRTGSIPARIFREVDRPTYDALVRAQVDAAVSTAGGPATDADLTDLLLGRDTWTVG